jgi:branched-chain amino acid transport system permease protein
VIGYLVNLLTEGFIFAVLALGLNVIWGWAGDFDIAYYGYVALGVYMTFVLTIGHLPPPDVYILQWSLPWVVAVPIVMLCTAAVALGVGALALRRVRMIYFAIITLSTVMIMQIVIGNYTPLFNGFNGLYGLRQPFNRWLNLGPIAYTYFFAALCGAVLLIVYVLLERLSNAPFGRALRACREDERAAEAFGRNAYELKLKAYVLGGAIAGLGGTLFAAYLGAFNYSAWSPIEALILYSAIFVGGTGNPRGVIAGVFIAIVLFQEATRFLPGLPGNPSFSPALREVLVGLLILVVLRYRPQGLFPERRSLDAPPVRRAQVGLAGPAVSAREGDSVGGRVGP